MDPIASMGLVYLPTFTININHSCIWVNMPYMDGMGMDVMARKLMPLGWIHSWFSVGDIG